MWKLSWLLGCAAVLVLGGLAHAAPAAGGSSAAKDDGKDDGKSGARADQLVQRAVQLRRSGDDQGALPLLKEANEISRSPRAAAQLGMCYQAIGQWLDAETLVSEGLKAEDDPWIKKNRPAIVDALRTIKGHVSYLEVTGEPAGAEVVVNGAVVGRLPIPSLVRVESGDVSVEVTAPGFVSGGKTVRIGGAQHQRVALRLERAPGGAGVAAAGIAAVPPPTASSTTSPNTAAGPSAPPTSAKAVAAASDPQAGMKPASEISGGARPDGAGAAAGTAPDTGGGQVNGGDTGGGATTARKSAKWVAWGLAAIGLGVGVYGTVRNVSLVSDFNKGCGFDPDTGRVVPSPGSTRRVRQCTDLVGRYESASHLGIGGFVGAGVLAAAGAVLWFTEPRDAEGKGNVALSSLTCVPHLTAGFGPGVGCGFACE